MQADVLELIAGLGPDQFKRFVPRLEELDLAVERQTCEDSLFAFLKAAWPYVDNSKFQSSWAIEATCDHLECVVSGDIKRLLINIPPRTGKTLLCSIVFPAWVWARSQTTYLSGPQVRFLCASYSHTLSLDSSNKSRRLIASPWFQKLWPGKIAFEADQNMKHSYANTAGGARMATSVGGTLLGLGGDILVSDDLNNTEVVESEAERSAVANFWNEFHNTRLNDPQRSAIINIQQRLHVEDVSGLILESDEDWVNLCIPMRYDAARSYVTVALPQYADGEPYDDPRSEEGELMWPERFPEKVVADLEKNFDPYLFAGRYQQLPVPKGGGIIQDQWWQTWGATEANLYGLEWTETRKEFPPCDLIIASLDTSYGEKEQHDFNAMSVWGIWKDRNGNSRTMLMYAWNKRLALHGKLVTALPGEPGPVFRERQKKGFGLVEWVADTCRRYGVQRLLIEGKTRGVDVANELRRLYARENWGMQLVNPVRDKIARTHSVVPLFVDGAVWAPFTKWSQPLIDQMAQFPKAPHDDMHDSATQALNWMRENGLLLRAEESSAALADEMLYRPRSPSVAETYGLQ